MNQASLFSVFKKIKMFWNFASREMYVWIKFTLPSTDPNVTAGECPLKNHEDFAEAERIGWVRGYGEIKEANYFILLIHTT